MKEDSGKEDQRKVGEQVPLESGKARGSEEEANAVLERMRRQPLNNLGKKFEAKGY